MEASANDCFRQLTCEWVKWWPVNGSGGHIKIIYARIMLTLILLSVRPGSIRANSAHLFGCLSCICKTIYRDA
jgi:hypothetical protein